ncbi:fluoride efflux transporter CrcB [Thermodesulfatator autotrophicus]|uniref:Fluoride-specific ion channel FluC n=1 Tax=Thermodesulfatator autotrophicus TaxID=1795632 RepID=A0A177EAE4_9BACT|nr:fluoride efflux transporter CrcB [Thermodesulfatator autotrophicus]OAG28491.1 camphor resistance protein CrcB [Thermodesulfatator autotrophicus]
MKTYLLVGAGGFLGAMARYWVSGLALHFSTRFPLGTLLVNVLGSFFLGFLMTLVSETLLVSPETRLFLAIGFLGAFTTFSTFAYETNSLLEGGQFFLAFLNVVISLSLGLIGVRLGIWVAKTFLI